MKKSKKIAYTRWMIAVDFNDITSNEEEWGGRRTEEGSFSEFNGFIEKNTFIDLDFEGNP